MIRVAHIYLKMSKIYRVNTSVKKVTNEKYDIKRAAISNLGIDIW